MLHAMLNIMVYDVLQEIQKGLPHIFFKSQAVLFQFSCEISLFFNEKCRLFEMKYNCNTIRHGGVATVFYNIFLSEVDV